MSRQLQKQDLDYWDALRASIAPSDHARIVRRRRLWAGRTIAVIFSVGGHLAIILAMLLTKSEPPKMFDDAAISVAMVEAPRPAAAPAPAAPAAKKVPTKPVVRRKAVRPVPAPAYIKPQPAAEEPAEEQVAELSDSQIAGARTAGSGTGSGAGTGAGGGPCNMVQYLQRALREDSQVQSAVAKAHSAGGPRRKAIRVWDGQWIRSSGEEGDGLAGVREAIMIEIAFAPEACRADPVQGLVVLSLNDGSSAGRLAIGSGNWRWSDLLRHR